MSKSIEEQAEEYADQMAAGGKWTASHHDTKQAFIDGAKARDAQWLKVVNELREALKFYKNIADCQKYIVYGACRCAFCKGDDKHRQSLTKADQMLKEMGVSNGK